MTLKSLAITMTALTIALAGCGGDDEEAAPPATTAAKKQAALPAELVGTYEAKREGGDFPPGLWKLAIGRLGEFLTMPPGETGFFNSPLTVSDGLLVVPPHYESGCTTPGEYEYTVEGDGPGGSLTLEATEDACATRASLLSASWTMTD